MEESLFQLCLGRYNGDLGLLRPEEVMELKEVTLTALDARAECTHELSKWCPVLERLFLKESLVVSFRDLGSGLGQLRVLSAARCGALDLDGIASLGRLEELYLPFNDIDDCAPLGFHETLEVLDLEANRISDEEDLALLGTCGALRCLSLKGNPLATTGYRTRVALYLPHLETLDDDDDDDDLSNPEAAVVSEALKVFRPRTTSSGNNDTHSRRRYIRPLEEEDACWKDRRRPLEEDACWKDLLDIRGARANDFLSNTSPSSLLTHGDDSQDGALAGNIAKGIRRRRQRAGLQKKNKNTTTIPPCDDSQKTTGEENLLLLRSS